MFWEDQTRHPKPLPKCRNSIFQNKQTRLAYQTKNTYSHTHALT